MKNKSKLAALLAILILLITICLSSCRRQEIAPTNTPIPPARSTPTPQMTDENTDDANNPVFADITDFETGVNAYEYGFANYREDKEDVYELSAEIQGIPELSSKGLMLSGANQSDSLLMYLTKNIVAQPEAQYNVKLDFDVATNIKSSISDHSNSMQAVYIKAGAANIPFMTIIDGDNYLRSNWDIGTLGNSGPNGQTLGTAEKINSDDNTYQYRHFTQTFRVLTDSEGLICIMIAADSGIPSATSIYFDNIVIEFAEG